MTDYMNYSIFGTLTAEKPKKRYTKERGRS